MKKTLFTLCCLCIWLASFSQQNIPMDDENKQAFISEVVEATGSTKDELFDRGLAWINKYYLNPTGVIQSKNMETGEIIGKAQFKITGKDKNGVETTDGIVAYTITLSFKDGKFKYEISRIHLKQASYYDVSKWMDTKDQYYNPDKFPGYIAQTNTYFDNLRAELKKAVKTAPVKKSKDW